MIKRTSKKVITHYTVYVFRLRKLSLCIPGRRIGEIRYSSTSF